MNSPWVLVCAGGVFPGVIAVAVVMIGSHACSERTDVWEDCWFVCGMVWKVQVMAPLEGGGASTSPGFT